MGKFLDMHYFDISGNEIKKGHTVLLVAPLPNYSIGRNNPAIETEFACKGVVTVLNNGPDSICKVHWENGTNNSYATGTLYIIDNAEGKCESIW